MAVRSQIEKKLAEINVNILRKDINHCCSLILSSLVDAIKNENKVELRGFGSFSSKELKAKIGRNPKTGLSITLPNGRKTIRFKPSKILLKRLNENFTENDIVDTY
jgi:integration host factor subunit beta